MRPMTEQDLAAEVQEVALPLHGTPDDFNKLLALVGDARVVLLGASTHGTHEFYRVRAEITKRLITERSFAALAVEGDWTDSYRANRFVRGESRDDDAIHALNGFERFPQWMWRNADVLDFVGWLRAHNDALRPAARVGFYGLDLYGLHASMDAVLRWLAVVDPEAGERARERFACFEPYGPDPGAFGRLTTLGMAANCEREVVEQLVELRETAGRAAPRDGRGTADDAFFAAQHARVMCNAERYYRAMFGDYATSWNLRDRHMADTLEALLAHLDSRERRSRVVVWAHSAHVGDARATEMAGRGAVSLGQLARQHFGGHAVNVGFTTYGGTVTAAHEWDEPASHRSVRPAIPGSYESLLHATGWGNLFLSFRRRPPIAALSDPRLERAIGVVYHPHAERQRHYFAARLAQQFDAVFHYDVTRAVEPVERVSPLPKDELPATYPASV
jgi:erythromycin esterase-like protein